MAVKEEMQVEVRCNEEGYKGAWIEGIVKSIQGDVCIVKLRKSFKGNAMSLKKFNKVIRNDGKSLVEVLLNDVRPIPPRREFSLNSLDGIAVEVRERDCWWPGFIVRQILWEGHDLWLVSFPHTKILTAYPLSYLRPAQEWLGGNWTSVPQEKNLNIGQVIRVLSDDETLKSNNREVSPGCSTKKRNPTSDNMESTPSGYESNANPRFTHCSDEDKNAKEVQVIEEEDVQKGNEEIIEIEGESESVLQNVYTAIRSRSGKRGRGRKKSFPVLQDVDRAIRSGSVKRARGRKKSFSMQQI